MKYRKKPVVIEAELLVENAEAVKEMQFWMADSDPGQGSYLAFDGSGLVIPTLEGDMIASWGDYIIRGIKGEFYPCKPGIFSDTYEPLEDS